MLAQPHEPNVPRTLCETTSFVAAVSSVIAPRPDEVTRPVEAPVAREHGLSYRLIGMTDRPVEAETPMAREHGLSGRLLAGTDLRLDVRVGRGASGEVYRAICARGGPPLAVKVLNYRSNDSVRLRFHREVEILREIDSPWVVKAVSEGMLPDGRPWYAMEYIDGHSLARVLSTTGRADPARVVRWLRGACRGLAAIHDAGWVHRDVKPANLVVVDVGGTEDVKIVDLGIAERIHAQPELLSGTPEYIAPEQAEFRPVDVRSDVYALGCCAYELLTGRRLVEGRSAVAKINVHIEGVHPCWPKRCSVPMALRRLVERCLARQPEARPPNMHALQADLQRVAKLLARRSGRFTLPPLAMPRPVGELELALGRTKRPRSGRSLSQSWTSWARTLRSVLGVSRSRPHAAQACGPEGPLTIRAGVPAG